MKINDTYSREAHERNLRIAFWRGPRAGWWKRRPRGRHFRNTISEPSPPVTDASCFRRCGNVSDMVRACTLVVTWSQSSATKMSKVVLDWLHPASGIKHCERCNSNYLAVQRYFQVWISSRLGGPPLARCHDVSTLEGGTITEAELKHIVQWVCDHLGCELPSEDDDLPPAA